MSSPAKYNKRISVFGGYNHSLITDDGDFAHKILSPKNHIFKTYLARLQHELTQNDIETLEKGITLADGTTLKEAKVEIFKTFWC